MKCCFISLGCDKNTVDSEKFFYEIIKKYNCEVVIKPDEADVVILNTCAFIEDAKNESIEYIKYLVKLKKNGTIKKILVIGCFATENNKNNQYKELFKDVDCSISLDKYLFNLNNMSDRVCDILSFSSFLKISDGCDKFCTYCIIPYLRGKFKSTNPLNLIKECNLLAKNGVKELNLVAQDLLSYGKDIINNTYFSMNFEKPIVTLINDISKIDGIEWIRLLYCYPEEIDDSIVNLIKNNKKVLHYIDMPIQHASNKILKLMNRQTTKEHLIKIIDKLRTNIPDICIRTTLIVGFPGETEEDFNELVEFVKKIKFDKLGVFTYSREKLSKSFEYPNQIEERVKVKRKKAILDIQKKIVNEVNNNKLGNIYNCIVEGRMTNKKNTYLLRPYFNARNIDDKLYVKTDTDLISGSFHKVKIIKSHGYDLEGVLV